MTRKLICLALVIAFIDYSMFCYMVYQRTLQHIHQPKGDYYAPQD